MANLQERRDKSGKLISYSIRVHRGRGADGKQLKPWTATFEKECREGVTSDSRLRFEEYCNYVIGLKEQRGIKHSTIVRYRELTERLYPLPLGSAFGSGKSSGRKQQLKIFIVRNADQAWVAVGSNNLTRGGLCTNYETCNTQFLNLNDTLDHRSYENLTEAFTLYQESNLVKRISSVEDIQELLRNGLIVTEQQSRQNSTKRSSFSANTHFGHRAVSNLPTASVKIPVPANLFAGTSSNSRTGNNESAATQQPTAPLHDSEVTAASFLSLEASSDVQATYWFEMRASTGGSRNILDLSSSAKLQSGTHPNVENGSIPGSVAFFGLDPMARDVEKNVTIVYNGISYYPSTIKFAPNNASWRIQLKGDAETGDESLSQYGKTDFAYHILVFHRVTSDHYILETMAESELDALKANSEFWATNGINKSSKAFGKIRIG